MKHSSTLLLSVLALAAAVACGSPNGSSSDAGSDHINATCPPKPTLTCTDPKSPPSYKNEVAAVVMERCSPCHFPGGISEKIEDLSTMAGVANAGTAIINQLVPCDMPPINGNTLYNIPPGTVPGLSAEQENTIIQWIVCGEPNN
jgi:hypothetical protein